jgi:putative inorganic carbon (HCO3(-)) transporter
MSALFGLYLVLLILRPQEFIPGLQSVPILQYLLLIGLLMWVTSRDKQASLPPFIFALLYLVFVPITVGINGWWGGVLGTLGALIPVLGIMLMASLASRRLSTLHVYMWIFVICATLLVHHSAVQLATGSGPFTGVRPRQGRPYYVGIFGDPNDLGQLFDIALAFAIYLFSISRVKSLRLALLGATGWLFYGIILTDSRGALIAALAIVGLEGWRRFGKIAVTVGGFLALPALFAATRLSQLSAGEQSANDRIQAWYEGLQMLRSNPVFGVGYLNFTDHNYLTAHNSIVLPMAELGLPGLAIWLGITWYSMRLLFWVAHGPHTKAVVLAISPENPALTAEVNAARGVLQACVGFAISAFFLSQSYKAPIFLLCGMAIARYASAVPLLPAQPVFRFVPEMWRLGLLTLGCVAAIFVIVHTSL